MTKFNELISRAFGTLPVLTALQVVGMLHRGEATENAVEELLDTADDMRAEYAREVAS